jgi:hypothetical protein
MSASCQPQHPLNFWPLKFVNVKVQQSFLQKVKLGQLAYLSLLFYFLPPALFLANLSHLILFFISFFLSSLTCFFATYFFPRRRQPSDALHRLALVSSTRSLGSGISRKTRELDYRSSSRLKIDHFSKSRY